MNKKEFRNLIEEKLLLLDGACGTELEKRNYLTDVKTPEELNIKFPERIADIYTSYIDAGSDIILANTFGANPFRLKHHNLEDKVEPIIKAAIEIARRCALGKEKKIMVAGDISSLGAYIKPLGNLSFDEAYEAFSVQAALLEKYNADLIIIETMTEIKELKAAVLGARENFSGPIIAQMTFTKDGQTVTGTDIKSFTAMVESLEIDGIGLNCSVGPSDLADLACALSKNTKLPISFKPNAGMPVLINKKTVFPGTIDDFIKASLRAYSYGVNMFGGCCGTDPAYIKALHNALHSLKPVPRKDPHKFFLSSRFTAIDINECRRPIIIGERINPTNRKNLQNELAKQNFSLVKEEARKQESAKAVVLDVNMGMPQADESQLLANAIECIQEIVKAPLCIDSSTPKVLTENIKYCAGRVLINSTNGETEKLELIMPIAKKYGAGLIALTTDEKGIPKTVKGRLEIAEKILSYAARFNIDPANIVFDYLVLAVSSNPEQALITCEAIRQSKKLFPTSKTVLGLSNISFGLPQRQIINSAFMKMAVDAGLDFAIANPYESWEGVDSYAIALLENKDAGAKNYIQKYANLPRPAPQASTDSIKTLDEKLYESVLYGDAQSADEHAAQIIKTNDRPFERINEAVLKALNFVGDKFASKEYFLPQIIMSAQSAQRAFSRVKESLPRLASENKKTVILATVKGDMHDIGKNIVGAVLESYGFTVKDLGISVEADEIINEAIKIKPIAIGLSALMTTTMPEMEVVVKLRDNKNLNVPVIVGGAAVTQKFADEIKADFYARDAVETAKIVSKINEQAGS